MKRAYFGNKAICFVSRPPADGSAYVELSAGDKITPAKVSHFFENSNTLFIVSATPGESFTAFCQQFTEVEAAGGLVENHRGEVLMIYRRGRWDLPKGHIETGESAPEAALRETEEETGLRGVRLDEWIADTYHFYDTYGRWEMKCCRWYKMTYDGTEPPAPQAEEDITRAEWLGGKRLWEAMAATYPTIREVFDRYLQMGL